MDVRLLFILPLLFLTFSACAPVKSATDVFPEASAKCLNQTIPGQFVVRWANGKISLEKAADRNTFIEKFINPRLNEISRADYNYQIRSSTEPGQGQATNYADNWGPDRIHAEQVWAQGIRGNGVTVAVVDSGVDIYHPQLINRIAYNKGESGTDSAGRDKAFNRIDDDSNGFVDDYAGYDFAGNHALTADNAEHGTHVSGIIVAEHFDSQSMSTDHVQGLAPEARLLPVAFIDSTGGGSLYGAIRGLEYAQLRNANIVNASWGGASCSPELRATITALANDGIIFVSAAGNDGSDVDRWFEYPASYNLSNQITVGAVGVSDLMASFSNYGDLNVHLFAPGVDIFSTVPRGQIASMSGTSMATPFVAGGIALLKSHKPEASISQIRQALYNSASKNIYYRNASRGRLDLSQALAELNRLSP